MTFELFVIVSIIVTFFVLIIKPLRDLAIWCIKDIVMPLLKFISNYILLYGLKVAKNIIMGHVDIVKNMFTSRAIIFPKNEDMREERDKAMNRKV
jgi:hypothetical protein